ncbi:NAD(P)-dependent oxidoreductase [Candidatus Peregrinibacteria bacterium CG1_02_54_53]|nr:MAG: NAD(P)-dependent oxidoreductase [Candidatus Peregrinibacteria bacterium CG1_02_54_53]
MAQSALITGATSGIGKACALLFARNGYNVIITGRRKDRLSVLEKELKKCDVQVLSLCFDVCDRKAVFKNLESLPKAWQSVDVLVNNAGLALGKSPIYEGETKDWDAMIDTNIKGLLYVTRAISPFLLKRKKGHIINIGSIAGKEVYKGGAVYNATKFAVDALTKAMRIDYLEHNIRVTSICPGKTETEFSLVRFKGDAQRAKTVYEGYKPLTAEDIAEAVWFAASRPEHVTINDMLIMPTAEANTVYFHHS